MGRTEVDELLSRQDGVISRQQAVELALGDADIRRLVRRREWARVHRGVFVNHTGALTWKQRAWAAVLATAPSALFGSSALRAADGPGRRDHDDLGPIHVAVDRDRWCVAPEGVVVHRVLDLRGRSQWNTSPPRMRLEEAVVDLAAVAATDFAAVAVVGAAVQSRRTTAERLLIAARGRTRLRRREFLESVLRDVRDGACSALEGAFLTRVERPHGLPRGERQEAAHSRGPIYRDVLYVEQDLAVELDGQLDHTGARDRDRDLERDLDASLDGLFTVRLGWGQAVDRPCSTAHKLGRLMQRRGWTGAPTRCPSCPDELEDEDGGGFQSPGD